MVRLWDKDHRFVGQIAQEKSVAVEELKADAGAGTMVIRKDNWLSNFLLYDRRAIEDVHVTIDPIPTQRTWKTRWGGKVLNTHAVRDSEGLHTVELEMVSNRAHLRHLLAGANPVFAPEVQLPKMWMLPWNLRTGLSLSMWINLARQFFPLVSIPTNLFNPASWVGVGLAGFNPLAWPIQVQFVNPITDQSRFSIFTSRWNDFDSVSKQLLEDAGCMIRAYTWLTEDETSPHPELEYEIPGLNIAQEALHEVAPWMPTNGTVADLARPHRNCVVMAVEDRSNIGGPTGTLLDGPIRLIAATADDMITETLLPFDEDNDGSTDPLVRKWFGVAPKDPWIVFRDYEYSGIVEARRTMRGGTVKTVMVGGKSPGWVNEAISFGIKYGLSQLSSVIQAIAGAQMTGPEVTGFQTPGTPGLEELYQGQLSDVFGAWQRFTHPDRAFNAGDFAFLEMLKTGGAGSAYTVAAQLDIRAGLFETEPRVSYATTVRNGAPYFVGEDFELGDMLGFQMGNVVFKDHLAGIRRSWDDQQPHQIELVIGTGGDEEDSVGRAMRSISMIWNSIGLLLGSGDLF